MTAGEAQALCGPALQKSAYDPQRDQRALEALARWLTLRFSPTVAIEGDDALLLDITGCDRLFHGTHNLLQQLHTSLHKLRFVATVAAASTPGAAWALAFAGCDRFVIPPDASLPDVLKNLPV
jgi:protein ImuB